MLLRCPVLFSALRASCIAHLSTRTVLPSSATCAALRHATFTPSPPPSQKPVYSSIKADPKAAPSFLADHKLEQRLKRWSDNDRALNRRQGSRTPSPSTHPRNKAAASSTSAPAASKTTPAAHTPSGASPSTSSSFPRHTLQRRMQGRNRIAVLHPADSQIVTLDLSIESPAPAPSPSSSSLPKEGATTALQAKSKSPSGPVVKSMAREEKEAASKTLDRLRMLFAPPRPKGQASQRHSREELLAACPTVRVYGHSSEVQTVNEEEEEEGARQRDGALAAAGSADVTLSQLVSLRAEDVEKARGDTPLYRELNTELPNRVFWKHARVLVLNGTTLVRVLYNVPTITTISPPGVPHVGLPLVCGSIALLFASAENVCYEWCVIDGAPLTTANRGGAAIEPSMRVVGRAASFTPTADLVGKPLMLRLSLDSATGLWTELRLPDVVRLLPPPVPRWKATAHEVAAPEFRVVTYNILYDDFCTSKSSKAKIYPFATDDILDLENRKVRIVQELLAYHADVLCLQECGRDVFFSYLLPVLRAAGYEGAYVSKNGTVKEGCGFLFRAERYELVRVDSVPLNLSTMQARHTELAERVGACPELAEALSSVTTVGARLVLRDKASEREMVLGNTHLFYHANACHIRILQAYMLLHWLHEAAAAAPATADGGSGASTSNALPTRPIVLCGDFNCTHPTGAYRLLTTGQVEAEHHSWDKGKLFWWGCARLLGYDAERLEELLGEETVLPQATVARKDFKRKKKTPGESAQPPRVEGAAEEGVGGEAAAGTSAVAAAPVARGEDHVVTSVFRETLRGPAVPLEDAYQRTDPSLPWTNFTLTFREVIDYIFYSCDSIEVVRTIPIPPESELAENFALPNKKYPSDHVALIADLRFKA